MTEMVNGEGQNFQNSSAGVPVTSSSASSGAGDGERTFKQSEVNELVGRAKSEAVERYKRESSIASHNYQPQQPSNVQPQYQQPYNPPVQPQYQGMSESEYRRLAAEEARRARSEWEQDAQRRNEEQSAQKIADEFFTKVGAGDGGIQEFEKVIGESGLDLRTIPYHVQLANMVENTKDVMIELAKNPTKIGQLQNLIDIDLRAGRQPRLALQEMKRLSQSIRDNHQASKFRAPNEPLSQLRPSNAGTDDKGALTPGDYRRNPKYRV